MRKSTACSPPNSAPGERPVVSGHAGIIVSISGRNQLRGYVDEVRVAGLLAQVRQGIGDQTLTAVIARDASRNSSCGGATTCWRSSRRRR